MLRYLNHLKSYSRAMRYTFFFLLETPFLGSRLELVRKVSISHVVSSKSVKTTRPYHNSVVLKRKRVDWHCYKDQQNKYPLENYNQRMRHLYFSLSCYKIAFIFKFDASGFLACFFFFFCLNSRLTNLNSLPAVSFRMNKIEDNPNMYILPCFK